MSWMRLASGLAACVISSSCCNETEFAHVKQQNHQFQRDIAELRRQLEVLQTEELNRRMQESDVVCCPCNATVGHTTGPTLNLFWQVTSGECLLEDDCLTSPNYPENYGADQACVIEITDEWIGYLDVHQFATEENFDFLYVNDVPYSGIMAVPPFNGMIPNGTIFWAADYVFNEAGFKICRTNVSATVTTTIFQAPNISDQSYNEFWGVTEGDCYMDTSGCIASPNYPQEYENEHVCLIGLTDLWDGASIDVIAFVTELDWDYLYINYVGYSGDELNVREMQGMVPVTTIMWSADEFFTATGWKICREASAPVEWANWTCTVLGDDCTRPFNNIYPNTSCSTLYSDPLDDDGDNKLHDGHPWCKAPSSTGVDVNQPCGPCSCLAGEAQTYNSQVLHDNWNSYNYIVCTPCVPGSFKSVGGYGAADLCSPCSSGEHTSIHGATACDSCEAGRVAATAGSTACEVCDRGHFGSSEGLSVCEKCTSGFYASGLKQTECDACPPGTGEFSAPGASSCLPCAPGRYSAKANSTACTNCDIGRFANVSGMDTCHFCHEIMSPGGSNPDLWTTMREVLWQNELVLISVDGANKVDDCGCDAGAWISVDSQCYECGEGVLCNGMGKVILMEGYFAPSDDAGDVWECHGNARRCPGGVPGTCAKNRLNTSLACGECEVGTRAATNGECGECGGGQLGLFVLVMLSLPVGLCVVYYLIATENRAKQKDSIALIAIMASQVVTSMQVLGVFDLLLVSWPEPFASVLSFGSLLNFNVDALSPNCVVSTSALMTYGMTVFGFVLLLAFLILIHCVSVVLFYGRRFKERMPSLIGAVGTACMAVFISISSAIFAPLQCEGHPNGYMTVQAYPQVICWSTDYGNGDTHTKMVILGAMASVVPISFIALCVWVVQQLPVRMGLGDTAFLHAFAFLFFRFQPRAYWYVLVLLGRNLVAAMVPVITDASLQIFCLTVVLGPCVVACAIGFPWRIYAANLLDLTTNMGFLLILFLAGILIDGANETMIANMLTAIFLLLCTLFVLVVFRSFYITMLQRGKAYQFFLCHHKHGGGGFTRLLKLRLKRDRRVKRQVFLDADNLKDLNLLFGFVGNNTDTLVVICSSEILARPWCVGEMTTARLHGVDTILVILPDFNWPSEDFVAQYASHVPGVLALAKFGISVSMTQETLEWLKTKPQLTLPNKLSLSVSDVVAAKLVSRKRGLCEFSTQHGVETSRVASEKVPEESTRPHPRSIFKMLFQRQARSNLRGGQTRANHMVKQLVDPAALPKCSVVAIVDRGNWDGVCVALLVREMLVPRLSTAVTKVPHVLTEEDSLPPDTQYALIICTNGCFHSASFARQVLEAEETGVSFIPIVGEENFHFPTETFYEEVRERVPITLKSQKHCRTQNDRTADDFVTAIEAIFREIAIAVVLQDSEDIIAVRVGVIAGRLTESTSLRHQASLTPGQRLESRGSLSFSSSTGNLDPSNQTSTLVESTTVDVSAVNACSTIHEASQSVSTSAPPPAEPWEEDTDI